ncbi:MAG: SprT-like domain-containing protein [Promethearchaeota archaeon]
MIKKSSLKIGDIVYFIYRKTVLEATTIKVNPKFARVKVKDGRLFNVRYIGLYYKKPLPNETSVSKFTFVKSTIDTNDKLRDLLEEVVGEYWNIYDRLFSSSEKNMLKDVHVEWGRRITYRSAGKYYPKDNRIVVTRSLKNTPEFVIKKVLHHELLHIHFRKHGTEFNRAEKMYKDYNQASEFISRLFQSIRYHGL